MGSKSPGTPRVLTPQSSSSPPASQPSIELVLTLPPSSRGVQRSVRRTNSARGVGDDSERCSCCTKDDFWSFFDIFQAMDRRGTGAVQRADFGWALAELGAKLEFQRTAHKARISAYFTETARDLSSEEFIRRCFPSASPGDLSRMQRWAELRKARNRLASGNFEVSETSLREVYSLLEDDEHNVSAADLMRARIVTREEVLMSMPGQRVASPLSFESFCELTGHHPEDFSTEVEVTIDAAVRAARRFSANAGGRGDIEESGAPGAGASMLPVLPTSPPASPLRPQAPRQPSTSGDSVAGTPAGRCRRENRAGLWRRHHQAIREARVQIAS